MKILVAHNKYQHPGGEDAVFDNEVKLLAVSGYDVRTLVMSNERIESYADKLLATFRTVENPVGVALMTRAVENFRPEIVHIHNFFPLLSPAVFKVCRQRGSAVVQTLHNYRSICAGGQLLRKGQPCHLCVEGSPMWGVIHRCYRGSFAGSAAVARMIAVHRKRQTWSTDVNRFIALSQFGRRIFIQAGFPTDRIDVKPNFIDDPGEPREDERTGALFVGRLSREKGAKFLIEASDRYHFPVRIAGEGPESKALQSLSNPEVKFLGHLSHESILIEMRRAIALVVPSLWYEGFPMVILEAFACATPVIVSRLGALAEIVENGATGFHVSAGDSDELGQCIKKLIDNSALARQLGRAARNTYLERYSPRINLMAIKGIYAKAVERHDD
jgi:glycosyltransferase involved in cell wall biosynthesis